MGHSTRFRGIMVKVGFTTEPGFISAAIRWITQSKASHVCLIVDVDGTELVIEAWVYGYRVVTLDSVKAARTFVLTVTPKTDLSQGLKDAVKWLGEAYDYSGLFGELFVLTGRWLKKSWRNPLANPRALFCSEAVTRILRESGYPGAATLDPASTSPGDLMKFMEEQEPAENKVY